MKRRLPISSNGANQYAGTSPLGNGVLDELSNLFGEALQLDLPPSRVSTPETRLMTDVLTQAIKEAEKLINRLHPPQRQADARAWLGNQPGFSARECCDAVGIDYDAMMKVLRERWKAGSA